MIGNILVDSAGSMENRHQVLPPIPIEDNRISVSLNIGNQIPQIPSELTKRSGPQSGKPTNTQCTPVTNQVRAVIVHFLHSAFLIMIKA